MSHHDVEVFLLLLPGLIVAMALHELAHGIVADRLGDPTARVLGRLTLNPIRHLDPLGSAMFALTYFGSSGSFVFGWAKPIPVDMRNFKNPKRDFALVAVAGPLTNFAIALVLVAFLVHGPELGPTAFDVLFQAVTINIVLGVFNLLPLPPLDGSRIVGLLMDDATYRKWLSLDQYAMITFIAVFFVLRGPFQTIIVSSRDHVLEAMVRMVGG